MKKGIFESGQEDVEVSAALGRLGKVAAPTNFEANVRSAIKMRSDRPFFATPGFLLGLKFALPAVVLLVLGAFLLFSTGGSENDQIAVSGTTAQSGAVGVTADAPADPPAIGQINNMAAEGGQVNTQAPVNRPARGNQTPTNGREFQGGSRDLALSPDNTSILTKSADPNQKNNSAPRREAPPVGSITGESFLSKMGISPKCVENGCAAVAVQSASVAERSGVKKGDLIEAIDSRPVKAGTVLEGNVIIRNVTVLRDGKRITIPLSNK